jgi:3-isopropylmalate dehydratase small subunit
MGISSHGLFPAEAIGEQGAFFSLKFVLQAERLQDAHIMVMITNIFMGYSSRLKALAAMAGSYWWAF